MKVVEQLVSNLQNTPNPSSTFDSDFHNVFARLQYLVGDCQRSRQVVIDHVHSMLRPALYKRAMYKHMWEWPLGYVGDFQIIDWTYTKQLDQDPVGKAWDEFYHRQAAPQAVRNRKDYLVDLFGKMCRAKGAGIRMLDVASGPCRDVAEAVAAAGEAARGSIVHCVDIDERAVAYAKGIVAGLDHSTTFRWQVANALRLRLRETYDLVWSAGLFDYLDDRFAASLLSRLWQWTAPGGTFCVGNFHLDNPSRLWMEFCAKWNLLHRSDADMLRLAEMASIPVECVRLDKEPLGVVVFLLADKPL